MIERKIWLKYFGELEEQIRIWPHDLRTSNQRIIFIKNQLTYFAKIE